MTTTHTQMTTIPDLFKNATTKLEASDIHKNTKDRLNQLKDRVVAQNKSDDYKTKLDKSMDTVVDKIVELEKILTKDVLAKFSDDEIKEFVKYITGTRPDLGYKMLKDKGVDIQDPNFEKMFKDFGDTSIIKYTFQIWRTEISAHVLDKVEEVKQDKEEKAKLLEKVLSGWEVKDKNATAMKQLTNAMHLVDGIKSRSERERLAKGMDTNASNIVDMTKLVQDNSKVQILVGAGMMDMDVNIISQLKVDHVYMDGDKIYAMMYNGCKGNLVVIEKSKKTVSEETITSAEKVEELKKKTEEEETKKKTEELKKKQEEEAKKKAEELKKKQEEEAKKKAEELKKKQEKLGQKPEEVKEGAKEKAKEEDLEIVAEDDNQIRDIVVDIYSKKDAEGKLNLLEDPNVPEILGLDPEQLEEEKAKLQKKIEEEKALVEDKSEEVENKQEEKPEEVLEVESDETIEKKTDEVVEDEIPVIVDKEETKEKPEVIEEEETKEEYKPTETVEVTNKATERLLIKIDKLINKIDTKVKTIVDDESVKQARQEKLDIYKEIETKLNNKEDITQGQKLFIDQAVDLDGNFNPEQINKIKVKVERDLIEPENIAGNFKVVYTEGLTDTNGGGVDVLHRKTPEGWQFGLLLTKDDEPISLDYSIKKLEDGSYEIYKKVEVVYSEPTDLVNYETGAVIEDLTVRTKTEGEKVTVIVEYPTEGGEKTTIELENGQFEYNGKVYEIFQTEDKIEAIEKTPPKFDVNIEGTDIKVNNTEALSNHNSFEPLSILFDKDVYMDGQEVEVYVIPPKDGVGENQILLEKGGQSYQLETEDANKFMIGLTGASLEDFVVDIKELEEKEKTVETEEVSMKEYVTKDYSDILDKWNVITKKNDLDNTNFTTERAIWAKQNELFDLKTDLDGDLSSLTEIDFDQIKGDIKSLDESISDYQYLIKKAKEDKENIRLKKFTKKDDKLEEDIREYKAKIRKLKQEKVYQITKYNEEVEKAMLIRIDKIEKKIEEGNKIIQEIEELKIKWEEEKEDLEKLKEAKDRALEKGKIDFDTLKKVKNLDGKLEVGRLAICDTINAIPSKELRVKMIESLLYSENSVKEIQDLVGMKPNSKMYILDRNGNKDYFNRIQSKINGRVLARIKDVTDPSISKYSERGFWDNEQLETMLRNKQIPADVMDVRKQFKDGDMEGYNGKEYIILSKTDGKVYLFDKNDNLVGRHEVQLGSVKGDSKHVRYSNKTTPSGRYIMDHIAKYDVGGKANQNQPQGFAMGLRPLDSQFDWDGKYALAIHSTATVEGKVPEHYYAKESVNDRRVSGGCVRVSRSSNPIVMDHLDEKDMIYVTPEPSSQLLAEWESKN